jgi:hypothetical protein
MLVADRVPVRQTYLALTGLVSCTFIRASLMKWGSACSHLGSVNSTALLGPLHEVSKAGSLSPMDLVLKADLAAFCT